MIDFKDLLDTCQSEAIANKLSPTESSIWRSLARSYSKLFSTPLHLVLNMDSEHVILNVYEYQLKDLDEDKIENLEHLMETIYTIEDPDYDAKKELELQEDIKRFIEEEKERVRLGLSIVPQKQKSLLEKPKEEQENLPTQGSINLEYLAKQDNES